MENYYGIIAAVLSPFFSSVSTIFKSEAAKALSPFVVVSFEAIVIIITSFLIAKEHFTSTKKDTKEFVVTKKA